MKERLKLLGAKRVWSGDTWYWILKEDYKPGEVFEIWVTWNSPGVTYSKQKRD